MWNIDKLKIMIILITDNKNDDNDDENYDCWNEDNVGSDDDMCALKGTEDDIDGGITYWGAMTMIIKIINDNDNDDVGGWEMEGGDDGFDLQVWHQVAGCSPAKQASQGQSGATSGEQDKRI